MSGVPPCPDCGAVPDVERRTLTHDPNCPLGALTDTTCEHDRLWFLNHPGVSEYWRPVAPDESASLLAVCGAPPGEGLKVEGRVRVTQVADGVRVRDFSRIKVVRRS